MQRTLMIAALVLCTARVALAQNVVGGDWQSILKLGSVELCVREFSLLLGLEVCRTREPAG